VGGFASAYVATSAASASVAIKLFKTTSLVFGDLRYFSILVITLFRSGSNLPRQR
jgi:hypothetical protein